MATELQFKSGQLASVTSEDAVDWKATYTEQLPRIYNFFRYRVGDNAVAEDLCSTTFEKAWRARERYRRDRAAFSTWLLTIARNVAADYFRRHRREPSLDSIQQRAGDDSPEKSLEQRDDFARLSSLLARLPDRERELLSLKYGAELTNRVIAQVTGLSESNVGTILHRAIQNLRAEWDRSDG